MCSALLTKKTDFDNMKLHKIQEFQGDKDMKRVVLFVFILLICPVLLVSCGAEKQNVDMAVYSFSGSNEFISVTNGIIVLDGEVETFRGGELSIICDNLFSDIASYSADFYIIKNGEKRTVLSSSVLDMAGGTVRLDGDDLGKISGESIITNYKMIAEEDWQNNLSFELTVADLQGKETVYELQMEVTKIV